MKKIVATDAPQARLKSVEYAAWTYAAVLVVMLVGQLFSFEDFIPALEVYGMPGGTATTSLVAGIIVFAELFALPFLLRMTVSPLMRWMSLVCALLAPAAWHKMAVVSYIQHTAVANGAMFGTKVTVPLAAQIVVSTVLLLLAAYTAWGLWPSKRAK